MKCENYVKLSFPALSRNESYARAAVGAFVSQLDPTVDELGSVKAAVSEAVTNCVVHAYSECETVGIINITARIKDEEVNIPRIPIKIWTQCKKINNQTLYSEFPPSLHHSERNK